MWRPLARRVSLYRRTGSPRLHPATLHLQVSRHKPEIPLPPSIDSASHFSRTPQFHHCHRYFSSISAEIHDDPLTEPLISEGDEITVSFDLGAQNVFDENSNLDLQIEDSNLEADDGLGDNFEGYAVLGQKLDAEDEHVKPNDPEKMESLLSLVQSGGQVNGSLVLSDSEKVGKIISHLCKRGMTKDAHLVYIYAKDKKISPPQLSVDLLICSLSCIGKGTEKEIDRETVSLALETLNDYYSRENRRYAIKPFSSVVKKLCWIEDVYQAKKLLLEMVHLGPPPGNAVFNCVINGLTKTGDMEEALSIMKVMMKRGLKPDVYTYSVIMSGYVSVGEMEKACEIFGEAKKNHSKLSPVMYHTLIRGFCKVEQYGKAVSLLGEMKKHGVNPSHDEYNKLIKSLCFKALDWETAQILEEDMRKNGVILNRRTRALICAIKELKEEKALKHLL